MTQLNIQDLINKAKAPVTNPAPATEVDPASNEGMFAMMATLPQEPTVYGKPAQEEDFSINAIEPIFSVEKKAFVGRSQGGVISNGYTPRQEYVVVRHDEPKFITDGGLLTNMAQVEVLPGNYRHTNFLTLHEQMIKIQFQEGAATGQSLSRQQMQRQGFQISTHIKPGIIGSYPETFDLNAYDSDNMLQMDMRKHAETQVKDLARKMAYNCIYGKALQGYQLLRYNQNQDFNNPLETNIFAPVLVGSGDDMTHGLNIVNLPEIEVGQGELYSYKNHYNNPIVRNFNTRFTTSLTVDFTSSTGANTLLFKKMFEIIRKVSDSNHIDAANGKNGSKGQISGKPKLVTSSAVFDQFMLQSKEANSTPYDNREFTENYKMFTSYVDIEINDAVFGYTGNNKPASGDPIALIYYPKSYYIAKFSENQDFFMKYNKLAWKTQNDVIAQYYQTPADVYGDGKIVTQFKMAACGFVANPFGFLQINKA